jgi:DNA-directed RNA polymerase subunit RPC12/RpoP
MGRYPRQVRDARLKCIECNAPVVETVEGSYACVDCGSEPVSARSDSIATASEDTATPADD